MKTKTSITLSKNLLTVIDQQMEHRNRSEFIERALWAFIHQIIRNEQNAKDIQIINKRAGYLNEEAEDVLKYQVKL